MDVSQGSHYKKVYFILWTGLMDWTRGLDWQSSSLSLKPTHSF